MKYLWSVMGNAQRLDGGAMFGNAPKALWQRWITPDDRNRIPLACRCLLVRDGTRNILFETGIGTFFEPKKRDRFGVLEPNHVLLDNLNALGLNHKDIDVIVLSHLHFDHAGGLLSGWQEGVPSELLFPKATILVGADAWRRALDPHFRDRASFLPHLHQLLQQSGRLEIVNGSSSQTLGSGYSFHFSHGHTPGLLLTEIDMPKGPIVFAGDLIPGTPWVHLPITMGYDRYPELLIEEKQKLLSYLKDKNGRLFFTHDATVAMSSIAVDERGRYSSTNHLANLAEFSQ